MPGQRARRNRIAAAVLFAGACGLLAVSYLSQVGLLDLEAASAPQAQPALVRFSRFSAHRELNEDGARLSVSLRVRTDLGKDLDCFAFVVARNDHVEPRLWSIWPPQPPGPAITAGGHFHGATPSAGHALTLSDRWQRLSVTVPRVEADQPYDTVVVYVLNTEGKILLARPFRV